MFACSNLFFSVMPHGFTCFLYNHKQNAAFVYHLALSFTSVMCYHTMKSEVPAMAYQAPWHRLNFVRTQTSLKFNECTILGLVLVLGCVLRKCVLPEGLAKNPPQILEIPKYLDSIDCTTGLPICTSKLDANTPTGVYEHVPDLLRFF